MISKEELIEGAIYTVKARNFNVAVWTGEAFKGPGIVYGQHEFVVERHYLDGLPLGTVTPIERISNMKVQPPFDGSNFLAAMETLNRILDGSS